MPLPKIVKLADLQLNSVVDAKNMTVLSISHFLVFVFVPIFFVFGEILSRSF